MLGWCGRLDLAVALANSSQAARYRTVMAYDLAGNLVATRTNGQQ